MNNEQNQSDAKAHPVDTLVMCEFLKKFTCLNNYYLLDRDITQSDRAVLSEAIRLGLVESWEPPKGASFYTTFYCSIKGRLFMKKNT